MRGRGQVQLLDQPLDLRQFGRVGRAHDDGIAARLRNERGGKDAAARAGLHGHVAVAGRGGHGAAARLGQAQHQRRQVGGHGVLERHHLHARGVGDVQRGDDAAHALQVVAVVGDDQRVAAGADVDGVVGADQRAQHGHQVGRVFMHEAEDLRLHLPAAGAPRRLRPHAAAAQLGFGLGQHQRHAIGFHHRKALRAQLRRKQAHGLGRGDGNGAGQRNRALHARVHHHVAAAERGHGARDGLDFGIFKIQRHVSFGVAPGRARRRLLCLGLAGGLLGRFWAGLAGRLRRLRQGRHRAKRQAGGQTGGRQRRAAMAFEREKLAHADIEKVFFCFENDSCPR